MRCIFSGKVLLPSPPALQDSHRGVGGNIGRGRDWVVVGCRGERAVILAVYQLQLYVNLKITVSRS